MATGTSRLREIETRLRTLESEKHGLVYAYLEAQGNARWTPYDYADGEKAVAGRRREILDEAARDSITDECQICERRQCMTTSGTMVHHGYLRPGHGSIEGDCFGVGRLPYPATDALVEYLKTVLTCIDSTAMAIAGLPARTQISRLGYGSARKLEMVTIVKADVPAFEWAREIDNLRARLESDARWWASEERRAAERITRAAK